MASHNHNEFESSLNQDGRNFSMKKNKDYTNVYQTEDGGPEDKKNDIFRFGKNFIWEHKLMG